MDKTAKRMLVVLLSVLIMIAFMPMMSFADDEESSSSLTATQMSSATELNPGDSIVIPTSGMKIYKFTATKGNAYGIGFNVSGAECDFHIYDSNGAETDCDGGSYGDNHQYWIYTDGISGSSTTYYFTVELTNIDPDSTVKITSSIFNTLLTSRITSKGKGNIYYFYNDGSKDKVTSVETIKGIDSYCALGVATPSLGYAFKGLYIGDTNLKYTMDAALNIITTIPITKLGKSITAKYIKIGTKAKVIQKTRVNVEGCSASNNSNNQAITVKVNSKNKCSKYYMLMKATSNDGEGYAYGCANGTTISSTNCYYQLGQKYTISICGAKKVKGLWVYTPWTKKTVTLK